MNPEVSKLLARWRDPHDLSYPARSACASELEAALSADRGVGEYNAQWLADVRRCLEDVATEMRATGRSDSRFVRLIECMPRTTAVAAPVGEVYRLRECVAFFASVIKGGEQWSDACQHAYDMAVASSGQKAN